MLVWKGASKCLFLDTTIMSSYNVYNVQKVAEYPGNILQTGYIFSWALATHLKETYYTYNMKSRVLSGQF